MKAFLYDFFYKTGLAKIAWHAEKPSAFLGHALRVGWAVPPARVLEVGCGLGTNSEWLAAHGFDVTGIDLSDEAVQRAQERLSRAGLEAKLYAADLFKGLDEPLFDVVFDRATLHSFPPGPERAAFAERMAELVKPGGSILLVEIQARPGQRRLPIPPFPIDDAEIASIYGQRFTMTYYGEEAHQHRVRGAMVLGRWRLVRAVA